jgi:hypothetical protein
MDVLKDKTITTEQIMERLLNVTGGGQSITDEQDVAGMELMARSGAKILSAMQELKTMGPINMLTSEQVEQISQAEHSWEAMVRNAKILAGKGIFAFTVAAPEVGKTVWERIKEAFGGGKPSGSVFGVGAREEMEAWGAATNPQAALTKPETKAAKKADAELERLQEQLSERIFQNSLKTMTVDQKRVALQKEMLDHLKLADYLMENGFEKGALEEQLKAAGLAGELAGLKGGATRGGTKLDVNSLQRIGAYARQDNEAMHYRRDAIRGINQIVHNTHRLQQPSGQVQH